MSDRSPLEYRQLVRDMAGAATTATQQDILVLLSAYEGALVNQLPQATDIRAGLVQAIEQLRGKGAVLPPAAPETKLSLAGQQGEGRTPCQCPSGWGLPHHPLCPQYFAAAPKAQGQIPQELPAASSGERVTDAREVRADSAPDPASASAGS